MQNGATNAVLYQSTSFSSAFNYLLGAGGIAQSGNTVYINSGAYTVDATLTIYVSGVTITSASGTRTTNANGEPITTGGAVFTAIAGLNSQMVTVYGNNVIINGGTFDGNGKTMSPSPTTFVTGANFNYGIQVNGDNDLITNTTVHNTRSFGITTGWGATVHNFGVVNNLVYDVGTNGIDSQDNSVGSYFINNEVWGCSDVGIGSWYDFNGIITGNYVHDNDAAHTTMYGYANSYWGIGFEGGTGTGNGNYYSVANNTINNVSVGIAAMPTQGGSMNYLLISGNKMTNTVWGGIYFQSSCSYSIIEYNTISISSTGINIASSSCVNNDIYGNTGTIYDAGSGTTYTQP